MIDKNTVKRYKSVNKAIFITLLIQKFNEDSFEKIIEEMDKLMVCWTMLGSALETSMQLLLTVYKHDTNPFSKWEILKVKKLNPKYYQVLYLIWINIIAFLCYQED